MAHHPRKTQKQEVELYEFELNGLEEVAEYLATGLRVMHCIPWQYVNVNSTLTTCPLSGDIKIKVKVRPDRSRDGDDRPQKRK